MTSISVVIATRNRPGLFAKALQSVLAQTCPIAEIIVVNDGTADEYLEEYAAILRPAGDRVRFLSLVQRPQGHGQSYSLNFGAAQATGDYLAFLDDDDEWSDPGYLSRVRGVIDGDAATVDLHFADQAAFADGQRRPGPIWIEDLPELLAKDGRRPEPHGAYAVTVDDLLRAHGFAHVNTTTVRRALFEAIGGLDENIRYENDRDFYLRLIDQAKTIRYTPGIVSHHRIPDPRRSDNMSTAISNLTKQLFQIRVLNKSVCFSAHPALRAYSREHLAYAMKKMTEELAGQHRYPEALFYARLALAARPTLKWVGFVLLVLFRSWTRG